MSAGSVASTSFETALHRPASSRARRARWIVDPGGQPGDPERAPGMPPERGAAALRRGVALPCRLGDRGRRDPDCVRRSGPREAVVPGAVNVRVTAWGAGSWAARSVTRAGGAGSAGFDPDHVRERRPVAAPVRGAQGKVVRPPPDVSPRTVVCSTVPALLGTGRRGRRGVRSEPIRSRRRPVDTRRSYSAARPRSPSSPGAVQIRTAVVSVNASTRRSVTCAGGVVSGASEEQACVAITNSSAMLTRVIRMAARELARDSAKTTLMAVDFWRFTTRRVLPRPLRVDPRERADDHPGGRRAAQRVARRPQSEGPRSGGPFGEGDGRTRERRGAGPWTPPRRPRELTYTRTAPSR